MHNEELTLNTSVEERISLQDDSRCMELKKLFLYSQEHSTGPSS
jgi:hypothetical protein